MKIAVVTGASSGMGLEFAKAIDAEETLDEIWLIARRGDRPVSYTHLDVYKRQAWCSRAKSP